MESLVPSPQTTLLIILGASEWPLFPEFQDSKAFANAVSELKVYFLDPKRFGLTPENVLDMFNSNHSSDEQDEQIGQFLKKRLTAMKATGNSARDLLVYFVGHGGFVGRDSDFYLAIRRTRMENPRASGIPMLSLADTLTEKARHLRRIIILDCCFAAAAFSAFQADPAQVAIEKTVDAFEVGPRRVGFPGKGTALLCSSSQKSPSLLLPDGSSTMFTKAFLEALSEGLPSQRESLSLREMKDLTADFLSELRNAPRPMVLSPDQSEGDVADIPFFPNPRAEERARKAEEERRRLAEEAEQTRRLEEERLQKVEEERNHRAEEERERKAREEQTHQIEKESRLQTEEMASFRSDKESAVPPAPIVSNSEAAITHRQQLPIQTNQTSLSTVAPQIQRKPNFLLVSATFFFLVILIGSSIFFFTRYSQNTSTNPPPTGSTSNARVTTVPVTVASKLDTESQLLGQMYILLLQKAGYIVNSKLALGQTPVVFNAIKSGAIDLYPEFTSTGLYLLNVTSSFNPTRDYQTVKNGFEQQYHITWLDQAPLNDGYALCTSQADSQRLGVTTLSQLAPLVSQLTLVSQSDGIPFFNDLKATYGFDTTNFKSVKKVDYSIGFQTVKSGGADVTECYTTDGSVTTQGFIFLNDDKHGFPEFHPAPIVRDSVLQSDPGIKTALNKLAPYLTTQVSITLQQQVATKHASGESISQAIKEVATSFLQSNRLL